MKKILSVIICAFIATSAFAQGFGGQGGAPQFDPAQMATRQADRIKEACGLNDEQYAKIKEFYQKQQEEMMKQFQQGGEGQERPRMSREDMQKRREAQTAEIKKILTEDQFKKYEEMQSQQRQRMGQGGPGMRQGGRPQGGFPGGGRPQGGFPGGGRPQGGFPGGPQGAPQNN